MEIHMPSLLPVLPGTISAEDKALLREAGFLVFEHPNPPELKVLGDGCDCDCGTLLGQLIAEIGAQIGDSRPVTLSVTAGPVSRMSVGPPVNADGSPVTLHPVTISGMANHDGLLDYPNTSKVQRNLWVTGGVNTTVVALPVVSQNAPPPQTAPCIFPVPPNKSVRVTWLSGQAPSIAWY
jgi:hypothetical protein